MSFRATLAPAYLALALAAAWFVRLAVSPDARISVHASRPYDFLENIRRERPDLVLVGNSLVYVNVDRALLERLLSASAGRPIKVFFAAEAATSAPWWYLVLKNQVAGSGIPGITVGLMTNGADLTGLFDKLSTRDLWRLSKLIRPDDDAFYEKVGERYRGSMNLYRRLPDRALIGRYLLGRWIGAFEPWLPDYRDGKSLLAARLELVDTRPFDLFTAGASSPNERPPMRSCPHPETCGERTFLPEIVRVMKPFRFFIIDSHLRPGVPDGVATPAYRKELGRYLARNGVPVISLRRHSELDRAELWSDDAHTNRLGQDLNTRLLAEEIVASRLLDQSEPDRRRTSNP